MATALLWTGRMARPHDSSSPPGPRLRRNARPRDIAIALVSCLTAVLAVGCGQPRPDAPPDAFNGPPADGSGDDVAGHRAPGPADSIACSDLAESPTVGSPLWCTRGGVNGCCDDAPSGVPICVDGKWQCPPGTVEGDLCCGFGPGCGRASARPECEVVKPPDGDVPAPRDGAADAQEVDGGPPGPTCAQPPPASAGSVTVGFSMALPGPMAAAHVKSATGQTVVLTLDAGGELTFAWPSPLPDLAAGDAVVLEHECLTYATGACWDVVAGPRAVAATIASWGRTASTPPALRGFTFDLAGCAFRAPPPGFCVADGLWAWKFDLVVARGSDQTTVAMGSTGTVAGWRFTNLYAEESPGGYGPHCVLDGGGSVALTATGPPVTAP
jgi:hypothetical protein